MLPVDLDDIRVAAERITGVAHRTPVLTSRLLNDLTHAEVFIKAEHLQRTGSFKIRGAYNTITSLDPEIRARGVVAFSSGNHAQAVAHSAQLHGIEAVIVMPDDAPAAKISATRAYGAEIVTYDRQQEAAREEIANRLAIERGLTLIRPYDDPRVIAGQGTTALELFEQVGHLDILLVCTGGGGLTSGCAVAAHHLSPECQVYAVEPEAGDDIKQSLAAGRIIEIDVPETIADGQMTTSPGAHTFAIMAQLVTDVLLVSDDEILNAMDWAFRYLNQVVEPSGASAFAALLAESVEVAGRRVGLIFSGGNIDPARFLKLFAAR